LDSESPTNVKRPRTALSQEQSNSSSSSSGSSDVLGTVWEDPTLLDAIKTILRVQVSDEFVPSEIVDLEAQMKQLHDSLHAARGRDTNPSLLLLGPRGSGKSLVRDDTCLMSPSPQSRSFVSSSL